MISALLTRARASATVDAMNKAAQSLGRMGKDKKKTLSKAERKRRAEQMRLNQAARWTVPDALAEHGPQTVPA